MSMHVDSLVFGGGASGLWIANRLSAYGQHVCVVESGALGSGQTVSSQGIIHSGIKYLNDKNASALISELSGMPEVWRSCIGGGHPISLRSVSVLSNAVSIWSDEPIDERAAMVAEGIEPKLRYRLDPNTRVAPDLLSYRVPELVIDTRSLISTLSTTGRFPIFTYDPECIESHRGQGHTDIRLRLRSGKSLSISARNLIIAAGAGTAELVLKLTGLSGLCVERPLRIVAVSGKLPKLFGHLFRNRRLALTVTSLPGRSPHTRWLLGGEIAECGASGLSWPERQEEISRLLQEVWPAFGSDDVEWSDYEVSRHEPLGRDGSRISGPTVEIFDNVMVTWPFKLALVPKLAGMVLARFAEGEASISRRAGPDLDGIGLSGIARAVPPWTEAGPKSLFT